MQAQQVIDEDQDPTKVSNSEDAEEGDIEEAPIFRALRPIETVPRTALAVIGAIDSWGPIDEDPPNSDCTWIGEWYYQFAPGLGRCTAWCAMTVSRALIEGGFSRDGNTIDIPPLSTTTVGGWAYVPYLKHAFQQAERYFKIPQPGDLFITLRESHTGIVADVDGDRFLTREGNWGGRLAATWRYVSEVDGFCRPPYIQEETLTKEEHDAVIFTAQFLQDFKVNVVEPLGNGDWRKGFDKMKKALSVSIESERAGAS